MGHKVERTFARRRGVSTIIGSLFFILILLIGFSMFTWEVSEFYDYNEVISEMTEFDTVRQSEHVSFEPPIIDPNVTEVGPGIYRITALLKNHGGVDVNISRIYIRESTGEMAVVERSNGGAEGFTNGYIPTGSVNHPVTITSSLNPVNGTETLGHIYEIRVTTDRGRTFTSSYPYTLYEPPSEPTANGTDGTNASAPATYQEDVAVGPASLNLRHWYWTAETNPSEKWPGWSIGRREGQVIWFVKLRNIGEQDVTILPESHLLLSDPVDTRRTYREFILSTDSTTANPIAYAGDIVLPSDGDHVELFFGASAASGNSLHDAPRSGRYTVSVVLYLREESGFVWAITLPYLMTNSE